MASIKLHAVLKGTNFGTESCDFRGDKFIGHGQGDEHRTLFEKDPASEEEVQLALELGPKLNQMLQEMIPSQAEHTIQGILGGMVGLRLGVWDE